MEPQENSSSFDKYWQVLKRRFVPALNIFLPVFLISLIASNFLQKPFYIAEGKLRFHRINPTSTLTGLGTEIGKLEPVSKDNATNPLDTEAEVIRSLPVIQKTIKKLKLSNSKGLPLKPKDFLKKLTVNAISKTDILKISYKDSDPERAAQVVNTLMDIYLEQNLFSLRAETAAARNFIERQLPNTELIVRQAEAELAKQGLKKSTALFPYKKKQLKQWR
ncbi:MULTISPECIES: GumC family protein [Nostoc]|uniref:GumC family protein n=1 Tax=Nostoc TaxID=1177 RepID=UPI0028BDCBF5|nr:MULTISPECIES: hypothetical protein [Nostoc]